MCLNIRASSPNLIFLLFPWATASMHTDILNALKNDRASVRMRLTTVRTSYRCQFGNNLAGA